MAYFPKLASSEATSSTRQEKKQKATASLKDMISNFNSMFVKRNQISFSVVFIISGISGAGMVK